MEKIDFQKMETREDIEKRINNTECRSVKLLEDSYVYWEAQKLRIYVKSPVLAEVLKNMLTEKSFVLSSHTFKSFRSPLDRLLLDRGVPNQIQTPEQLIYSHYDRKTGASIPRIHPGIFGAVELAEGFQIELSYFSEGGKSISVISQSIIDTAKTLYSILTEKKLFKIDCSVQEVGIFKP